MVVVDAVENKRLVEGISMRDNVANGTLKDGIQRVMIGRCPALPTTHAVDDGDEQSAAAANRNKGRFILLGQRQYPRNMSSWC